MNTTTPPGGASGPPDTLRPSDWRIGAWRTFLRAHNGLMRTLENEMLDQRDLSLLWYDVLVQLVEAPGRRLRMAELADRVLMSRSGLTRMIDRLEAEGWVRRERSAADARGTYTVLTRAGFDVLREAAPIHLAGVRDHFLVKFTDEELRTLTTLMQRLLPEFEKAKRENE